jgi:DNA-binding transcriptional MerR regulator
MEYTIQKLAGLAGVSSRTLRYYDEVGLLSPARVNSSGYRIYGKKEVDRLQQILFYREMGVPLGEIGRILSSDSFDELSSLQQHLAGLQARKQQLELLVANVERTIRERKGEILMSDKEKFEGFLQKMVDDNEKKYGENIREKYGEEKVKQSNERLRNMTQEEYDNLEKLTQELNEALKLAVEQGDPGSELAQKACELHKRWLCQYWETYSKEAHKGITQMYVDDPRFAVYYDNIYPGSAVFLRDAVAIFCEE